MNKEKYKLKAKNFWRKNEKLILMIAVSFVVGAAVAGFNYFNYQDIQQKYQLEEPMEITNQKNANFSFNLENPELASGTTIRLQLTNVSSENSLQVYVNGDRKTELRSNTGIIEVEASSLERENLVEVKRPGIGFTSQRLVDASVTSTTRFQDLIFVLLNFGSIILMAAPLMYVKYEQFQRKKKMEDKFPEFLRDVVEGTRAGMSLPQAIQNTETGSYGPLDNKIEKMTAQIDWGVPFEDVLENFGESTGSEIIERSVDTIIQAYSSGGDIQDVLDSVGDNIRTIKELKEQRESQLYGEMVTGYIVFFIFIGILIALTNFLLPNLAEAQASLGGGGSFSVLGGGGGSSLTENINLYETWFKRLVYIQALFSGLIIGKLAEGELKAGFKHMAVLFAVGYLAITFFL